MPGKICRKINVQCFAPKSTIEQATFASRPGRKSKPSHRIYVSEMRRADSRFGTISKYRGLLPFEIIQSSTHFRARLHLQMHQLPLVPLHANGFQHKRALHFRPRRTSSVTSRKLITFSIREMYFGGPDTKIVVATKEIQ
jgi:hypothetical protein